MKNSIFTLFLSIVFLTSYSQTSTNIAGVLATPLDTSATNYVFVVKTPGTSLNRWAVAKMDSLKLKPWNIIWLTDTILSKGDARYAKLFGSYTDPSFIQSLNGTKVFGLSQVAFDGLYSSLSGTPNLSLYYPNANPLGFIPGTNITIPFLNSIYGYQPYDGDTNPLGFLTSAPSYNAGLGLNLVGTTFIIDTNEVMTPSRAKSTVANIIDSIGIHQRYDDTLVWDATIPWVLSRNYFKKPTGDNTQYLDGSGNPTTFPSIPTAPTNISAFTNDIPYIRDIDTTNKWYPRTGNPSNFLTSFTELDPTVGVHIKAITTGNISTWNSALQAEVDPTVPAYSKTLSTFSVIKASTDSLYKPIGYQPAFSDITSKPTTLVGYGITDGITNTTLTTTLAGYWLKSDTNILATRNWVLGLNYVNNSSLSSTLSNYVTTPSLSSTLSGYATTSALSSGLSAKQDNLVSGTNIKTIETQSILGSGNIDLNKSDVGLGNIDNTSDLNKPISTATQTALNAKQNTLSLTTTGSGAATLIGSTLNIPTPASANRQDRYSGTTDGTGTLVITFSSAFPVAPNIQASISNQSATNQFIRVTAVTTTTCTVNVFSRASLNVLGLDLIAAATVNVSGATVDILATAK